MASAKPREREERVAQGIAQLELWMDDLARRGLGSLERGGDEEFREEAKRMVDAQAPALASRLKRMGALIGGSSDWPEELLVELGRLKLLAASYRNIDRLGEAQQAEVRQLVGWTLREEDLREHGDLAGDRWLALGGWEDEREELRMRCTWLRGLESGRWGRVLQFAYGSAPFQEHLPEGHFIEGCAAFYPGLNPLRMRLLERKGSPRPFQGEPRADSSIEEMLQRHADALAENPWMGRFPVLLGECAIQRNSEGWKLSDASGAALPLRERNHWELLAVSGGWPVRVFGEWDGRRLAPLSCPSSWRADG